MIAALTILLYILNTPTSHAINEFTTNQEINYTFDTQGQATVEHQVQIINNFSQFYPKEYSLSLSGSNITNVSAFNDSGAIIPNVIQSNDNTKLSLILNNSKTGKGQITPLTIRYNCHNLANRKGKTWEISLPQLEDNLSDAVTINLTIPLSFGKLSSSPNGISISTNSQNQIITFKKYNPKNKLILTFGEYQLFDFQLKYSIQNTTDKLGQYTIPIPPDTHNQKIYFTQFDPKPLLIKTDPDDNWLAVYEIPSHSKIDVAISGQAKIGQNPYFISTSVPIFDNQLYWETNNPQIISLAKTYHTPRQIYDFVVSTLNYDYNRINDASRRGALTALSNPNTSLCTDFTDLFVTISRAANIGAREIEGYAYSNNIDIKPLSVGTDILHAWPEYYDSKNQKWIAIDPTWAKTTGGINYFDDLDLNHFAFVIHNSKSDAPSPPGSYKTDSNQKTVTVNFADTETLVNTLPPVMSVEFNPFGQSYLIIKNPNLFALDKFTVNNSNTQNILPLGEIKVSFPQESFLLSIQSKSQNIKINYSYHDLPFDTISVQNPYHFFNLFIAIIFSLILLSFGAIILLRQK